ncbi:hypothetical protein [Curvibacter fontanus]|jgi:hypothetical protein
MTSPSALVTRLRRMTKVIFHQAAQQPGHFVISHRTSHGIFS